MSTPRIETRNPPPPLLRTLLLAALAGAMGWGVRGQYGHETGAMVAGVLVGLVIVLEVVPRWRSLRGARAVAFLTVGISLGGSMTYGQTVGLTHDAPLVGNWAALTWGMLGLAVKGGLWIGLAGAFFGMGLGGKRYGPLELAILALALILLLFLGVAVLNEPWDPAARRLPWIYFSDDWRWEPDAVDLKPRRERWGGLLFVLAGLVVYASAVKRDRLVPRLAAWGSIAGGIGFPLGQSVQAWHAWNRDLFACGLAARIDAWINWWNFMESIFGAVIGLGLALGVRRSLETLGTPEGVRPIDAECVAAASAEEAVRETPIVLSPAFEVSLVVLHVAALATWQFLSVAPFDAVADTALAMIVIPLLGIAGGKYWPYLVTLPITLVPVAGKTLRELCYANQELSVAAGWTLLFGVPLAVATGTALLLARGARTESAESFARRALLVVAPIYFGLNLAFFRCAWPFGGEFSSRTPNGLVYFACAAALVVRAALPKRAAPARETGADRESPRQA
jgi:hypothetical protein